MSNYCLLHCYIAVKVLKSSLHVCFWCIPLWNEHLGANGETQHSLSLSSLPSAEMCLSASREFKLLPFLKPTKCRFSSKLMQMFRNWVSNICKCFSLLDKNVWPLKSLGVYCFQKEGGQNYNPASLITLERLVKSFGRVGRCGWENTLENIQSRYLMAY